MSEQLGSKIAEGKTKIIRAIPGTGEVLIQSKDDITAGDGEKHDTISGKAVLATKTTSNCFELLERAGIPTHFLGRETADTFRAKFANMIPLELVARRVAFGSYLKRNPDMPEGARFDAPTFEFFAKDDPNHDPYVVFDFEAGSIRRYNPKAPVGPRSLIDAMPIAESPFGVTKEQAAQLRALTIVTFEVLEAAWAKQDTTLADLKIEGGITDEGAIVVADVIDNDSWRIWPGGDPDNMADKQLYRDDKPISYVADRYAWVAEATNAFPALAQ